MVTIKSFTDISQSKKLATILPLESADMKYKEYTSSLDYSSKHLDIPSVGHPFSKDIPCWSLAALISVLPYPHIEQNYKGKWICRVEYENTTYLWEDSNPVDACVTMIEKLHKLNLL